MSTKSIFITFQTIVIILCMSILAITLYRIYFSVEPIQTPPPRPFVPPPQVYDVVARIFRSPFDCTIVIDIPQTETGISYFIENNQLIINNEKWKTPKKYTLEGEWVIIRQNLIHLHRPEAWSQIIVDLMLTQ